MLNTNDVQTLDELESMPTGVEERYDCPVCVGLPMEKLKFALSGRSFTLDGCKGCGGIWFDAGEMKLAAELGSSSLLGEQDEILRLAPKPMACHSCGDLMGRNFHKCPSCGWKNVIDCPVCEIAMDRRSVSNFVIDQCPSCEGTWLDRIELRSIAHLSKTQQSKRSSTHSDGFTSSGFNSSGFSSSGFSSSGFSSSGFSSSSSSSGFTDAIDGTQAVVEILAHTPEAGQAMVEMSSGLVEVLGAGLEAVPEVAGVAVEAIGGIFELLGGLLSGL
jgi:Zn-finger nucleic acid-binding protein